MTWFMVALMIWGAYLAGRDALSPVLQEGRVRLWCGALSLCFMAGAGFWVWAATL